MQLPGLTIGIVADDLTGACDTALQFFKIGCDAHVLLESSSIAYENHESNQVWVVNTESRHISKHAATAKVRDAVARLKTHYEAELFYKKMDSTLRGSFTSECLAMVDELGWDCAVVAPAYPQEWRQTVGGYQLVHGIPVEQAEVARDPQFPVRQSHIPTIMAEASKPDIVGHIELATVMRGAGPLLGELTDKITQGCKLIVVDACSNTDLEQIALAIEKAQKTAKILPCGSAGLAQALCKHWPKHDEPIASPTVSFEQTPILIGIGSNTALTRTQLHQLQDHYPFYGEGSVLSVISLTAEHILGLQPVEPLIEQVKTALGDANTVVVSSTLLEDELPRTFRVAEEQGIAEENLAAKVQATLSHVIQAALHEKPLKLILTGGETAAHITQSLDSSQFQLRAEVEPSIPLLEVTHRPVNNVNPTTPNTSWVVTKSGNFGSELALANVVRYFKQHETD